MSNADGTSAPQRTIAVIVALAIHALLVLALVWRPSPSRDEPEAAASTETPGARDAADEEEGAEPTPAGPDHGTAAGAAPAPSAITPEQRARRWVQQLEENRARTRREQFGEPVASIMTRPLRDAWTELAARAAEGDTRATAGLLALAAECEPAATVQPPSAPARADELEPVAPDAPPDILRWLGAANVELEAREREQAQVCRAEGIGMEAFRRVVAEQQATEPLARWFANVTPGDPAPQPPPELMDAGEIFAELGAMALLDAQDSAVRDGALAYLDARGALSRDAAAVVAQCYLTDTCGVRRDAPAARAAIERAAAWGESNAIQALADEHARAGDPVQAWAWRSYDIALVEQGCVGSQFSWSYALVLAGMYQRRAELERAMTPAQRDAARRQLVVIDMQHATRTRAALGCAP